jgi:hypothetical protein
MYTVLKHPVNHLEVAVKEEINVDEVSEKREDTDIAIIVAIVVEVAEEI